jgi:pyruvate-ferredoxin/flavodoxin oxidoreductase
MAPHAAKLALEGRAFPFLVYDPDAGGSIAECLDLAGNPDPDADWPSYELEHTAVDGAMRVLTLPLTVADWAATERRFAKHFTTVPEADWSDEMTPFHEYVAAAVEERRDRAPFIWALDAERRLVRLRVAPEIVRLAEDRLDFWNQLRELAGLRVPAAVRETVARELAAGLEERLAGDRARLEVGIARRLAEGLLRSGGGKATVDELLARAMAAPGLEPIRVAAPTGNGPTAPAAAGSSWPAPVAGNGAPAAEPAAAQPGPAGPEPGEDDDALTLEPYIESELCTSCDECIHVNNRMFAYDDQKRAYIKDPRAGTYRDLVTAAERCTARIIHPGTPLDHHEKDLDRWVARAAPFN